LKINKEKCEVCGEKNKNVLDAHHVIPRSDPKSTDKANNLICLCSNCHRRTHNLEIVIEGRYNTTAGLVWFWHYKDDKYIMCPGVILNKDGTATINKGI